MLNYIIFVQTQHRLNNLFINYKFTYLYLPTSSLKKWSGAVKVYSLYILAID